MKKKKSIRVWCERCLRWQVHKADRCPLFPEVPGVKKWSECVCTIHTCYDAKEMGIKRNKKNAPTYVDFAVEE